jgi:hypothetical protein
MLSLSKQLARWSNPINLPVMLSAAKHLITAERIVVT